MRNFKTTLLLAVFALAVPTVVADGVDDAGAFEVPAEAPAADPIVEAPAADLPVAEEPEADAPLETAAAQPPAETDCAADTARQVQAYYESVKDLRAAFRQTRQSAGGAEPAREGTVVLAKPGRMRWAYEKPEPSLLVTDGRVLWMYDPLLEEAQRLPDAGGVMSGAAVEFLMGQGDLLASFEVSVDDCGAKPRVLRMLPRKDAGYERLALEVDPADGRVESSTVTDLFGNRTRVVFEGVRTNTGPEAALFRFSPPEGVEVFDLTVPSGAQGTAP